MAGYERYRQMTAAQYDQKTPMYYLFRVPANRKLVPEIHRLSGKKILDVGLGTGSYTRLLLEKNTVVGVDQNPHLCELPIPVHCGDAADLALVVGSERFDIVLSTWMTDYFDLEQLQQFFQQADAVLNPGGKLMTTMITPYGFGSLYVRAARWLRGVDKYTHSKRKVARLLQPQFTDVKFIDLNAWFCPWAYLVIAIRRQEDSA